MIASPTTTRFGIDVAGLTDRGFERSSNEDQYLVADLEKTLKVRGSSLDADASGRFEAPARDRLLVVADGVGGQRKGEVASEIAVRAILARLAEVLPWFAELSGSGALGDARELLSAAMDEGHREVVEAGRELGAVDMATTLTLAYVSWPRLIVAHVGDSRAYLLRRGRLRRLTRDHTLADELGDGGLHEVAARWSHVVTRAVGGGRSTPPRVDVRELLLAPRDVLLLCSDGLTGEVDDTAIGAALARDVPASEIAHDLVDRALGNGGHDNVTVVVARMPGVGDVDLDQTLPGVRRPGAASRSVGVPTPTPTGSMF